MTPNDRAKQLRQALGMTQTEFGEKLGVSKGVIVNLELSRVELKDMMINLICRTFKVNTLWLEKGEGEMLTDGDGVAVLTVGPIGNTVAKAICELQEEGIHAAHYNMIFVNHSLY